MTTIYPLLAEAQIVTYSVIGDVIDSGRVDLAAITTEWNRIGALLERGERMDLEINGEVIDQFTKGTR